jgi:hypothetical protein
MPGVVSSTVRAMRCRSALADPALRRENRRRIAWDSHVQAHGAWSFCESGT